jgi:hypothetical protein
MPAWTLVGYCLAAVLVVALLIFLFQLIGAA